MLKLLFQDWERNSHDTVIRVVLVMFRLSQWLYARGGCARVLAVPYFLLYKSVVFYLLHIELHWSLSVGGGLRVFHGYCLVIHPQTRIGRCVTLRHCVTLGNKESGGGAPLIGDDVEIGCNTIVIGTVSVGNGAVIGAGAVVTKDVPARSVVAGNPAKVIRMRSDA